MTNHVRVINRTPVYNGKRLLSNSQFEFWLQHSIINGDDFKMQFQEMINNESIASCTTDTFQLILDYIAGKISKRNGRPASSATKKILKQLKLVCEFEDELNVHKRDRMKTIEIVANKHGISDSEVDKALKAYRRGVRNSRSKIRDTKD